MLISKQLTFYPQKSDENRKSVLSERLVMGFVCEGEQFTVAPAVAERLDVVVAAVRREFGQLLAESLHLLRSVAVVGEEAPREASVLVCPVFVIGTPKFQDWVAISIKS